MTKTREPYKWDVPKPLNHAIELLQALHKKPAFVKELGTQAQFTEAVKNWHKQRVMPDAEKDGKGVTVTDSADKRYSLRSIRVWHGTNYVRDLAVAKREGKPDPPNPLQHTNVVMTKKKYATERVDRLEAGKILKKR